MFLIFVIRRKILMAESVTPGALRVGVVSRAFEINISTDNVTVARDLIRTVKEAAVLGIGAAVTLGALYGYRWYRTRIDESVKRGLGGERDDQSDPDIKPGSLHVLLRCLTDERFLEVLEDYESGRMKECLQEEFSKAGIIVTGLKVEIKNIKEVYKTKEAIDKRYNCIAQKIYFMYVKYFELSFTWLYARCIQLFQ